MSGTLHRADLSQVQHNYTYSKLFFTGHCPFSDIIVTCTVNNVITLFSEWKYFRTALVVRKFVTGILFHCEHFSPSKHFLIRIFRTGVKHMEWTAVRSGNWSQTHGVNSGTQWELESNTWSEQRYAVGTGVKHMEWTAVRSGNWSQTHGVNSGTQWEGELKSAAVNNSKCEGIISTVPWSRSLLFSSNKRALCSRTCIRNFLII